MISKLCDTGDRLLGAFNWIPLLLARVSVGAVFVESGWGKLHHLEKVVAFFTELKIPFANVQAPMVATFEFVAGIMLILGCGTRIAAVLIIGIMTVAIKTAKASELDSITSLFGISEFQFIVVALILFFFGPGKASLDVLLKKHFCSSHSA